MNEKRQVRCLQAELNNIKKKIENINTLIDENTQLTCVYSNKDGKCTNERYLDGIKKEYQAKGKMCLFLDQDWCPLAD